MILSMDANMDVWKSPAALEALTSGNWFDVGTLYSKGQGPEPTFNADKKWDRVSREGATRPDVMLINRAARAALVG